MLLCWIWFDPSSLCCPALRNDSFLFWQLPVHLSSSIAEAPRWNTEQHFEAGEHTPLPPTVSLVNVLQQEMYWNVVFICRFHLWAENQFICWGGDECRILAAIGRKVHFCNRQEAIKLVLFMFTKKWFQRLLRINYRINILNTFTVIVS